MNYIHRVSDIGDREALVRYATRAQIASVDTSQARISKALKMQEVNLNHCLAGRRNFSADVLRKIDEVIVALAAARSHVGGLAQFGVRVRNLHGRESIAASIPSSWSRDVLNAPAEDELQVLIQASTLLTSFVMAHRAGQPSSTVRNRYEREIGEVTDRLILIAGAPPGTRNIEAQILLGGLAGYAFEIVMERLTYSLEHTPLGFRVWRALTKVLMVSQTRRDAGFTSQLNPKLKTLLGKAQRLRQESIYPGRSLDLELAIAVPLGGLGQGFITDLLLTRANDADATLRERGTAAMGIWQRAVSQGQQPPTAIVNQLQDLVGHFRQSPCPRPDVASGLRWVATTLEHVLTKKVAVCNDWPRVEEPWFDAVADASAALDEQGIPPSILPATKQLFLHSLLQNAGVERRIAIDTLAAGGWVKPVAWCLKELLQDERTEEWLRIRALFVLGFIQLPNDPNVRRALVEALQAAFRRATQASGKPARAQISELHTALFAIGDCFGVRGFEPITGQVRDEIQSTLIELVERGLTREAEWFPVARALTYVLTFTAQARNDPGTPDLSERLLSHLRDHPDEVTGRFSSWTLQFRFGPHGEVLPLLRAAAA